MKTWLRWTAYMQQREAPDALAVFRVCVGACVVGSLLSVIFSGLVPVIWFGSPDGGYHDLRANSWLVVLMEWTDPVEVQRLVWAGVLGGCLMVVGLGGRFTALLTLLAFQAVSDINPQSGGSYDYLIDNALWLLVLGGGSQTLSLDCRIRRGTWSSSEPVSAWPRWLIVYQLVLVYFSTGLHKLSDHWTPAGGFSALYYTLQQPSWHRTDMSWLAHVYPVTQIMTACTWLFELSAPVLLLVLFWKGQEDRATGLARRVNGWNLRAYWVAFGVSLHLGILVVMEVGPFSWIALSYYVALFRGGEWANCLDRVRIADRRLAP